jgi:hypothetical protein
MKKLIDATRWRIDWSDITLDEFEKVRKCTNSFEMAEALTGTPAQDIARLSAAEWQLISGEINSCLKELPSGEIGKHVSIGGKYLKVPAIMEIEARRFEALRHIIGQCEGDTEKISSALPKIIAHVMCPEYTDDALAKFEELIRKAPFSTAYPLGTFFLTNLTKRSSGTSLVARIVGYLLRKLRQVLKG